MQTSINETLQSQPIAAASMAWTIDYRITDSSVPFSVAMSPAEIDKRNAAQRCMKLARQRMATHISWMYRVWVYCVWMHSRDDVSLVYIFDFVVIVDRLDYMYGVVPTYLPTYLPGILVHHQSPSVTVGTGKVKQGTLRKYCCTLSHDQTNKIFMSLRGLPCWYLRSPCVEEGGQAVSHHALNIECQPTVVVHPYRDGLPYLLDPI